MEHVWVKGDKCIAKFSGDGNWYEAQIERLYKNERGHRVAWVRFDGYSSEEDEEVKLSHLKLLESATRRTDDPVRTPEKPSTSVLSSKAMFSPLQGDEEKRRLEEKFKLLEMEEEEESKKRRRWDTTKKTLTDVPKRKTDASSKTTPKRKALSIKGREGKVEETPKRKKTLLNTEKKNHDKELKSVEAVRRNRNSSTQSPKVVITTTGLSSSDDEKLDSDDEDQGTNMRKRGLRIESPGRGHSGFGDDELEKPCFSHEGCSPKVPCVLSSEGTKPVVQIPATMNRYLRDYQREGAQFMYNKFREGGGGILGDDMGLGKTVQVIAFMSAILGKTGTKRDVLKQRPQFIRQMSTLDEGTYNGSSESNEKKVFLIIGPASVLYNWIEELETWGYFSAGRYHKQHKAQTIADLERGKLDVVVTTFETCRDNVEELNRFKWTAIIADEVHKIKSPDSEVTVALKGFSCKRRIGLTGTALQNSMKELWCILDWSNPKCLGNIVRFELDVVRKIEKGLRRDATKRELAESRKEKDKFSRLREQWMIRRTKAIIADQLPKKDEKVMYCKPTPFQISVYKAILNHQDMKLIMHKDDPCRCGSGSPQGRCCYGENLDGVKVKALMFTFMHLLLKASNHAALLMPDATESEEQRKRAKKVCKIAFASHPQFIEQTRNASFKTLSDPKYCGKMKVLRGLLSVFHKERCKVLLFSLSTKLLDIIEQYIISEGYDYSRLDGKTNEVKRVLLVREFNKDRDKFIFLASTKAGGVGLNLTGANIVIIFDPNWNPTHDLQAQDRAYRIGQGRDVRVFRLVCSGTIEENIYLRQVYKQQIDNVAVDTENARRYFVGVQGDKKRKGELFGIQNMFTLRTGDKCLTEDILQRHEKLETSLKGFNIEKYVPSEAEIKRDRGEPEDNDEKDKHLDDNASDEENTPITNVVKDTDTGNKILKQEEEEDVYGADYVCTQLMDDFNCDSDSTVDNSSKMKKSQVSKTKRPSQDTRNQNLEKQKDVGKSKKMFREDWESSDEDQNLPKCMTKGVGKKSKGKVVFRSQDSEIPAEDKSSFESVSDVFRECGVVHTHENRKVIGSSKVEDHVTRCAIQDVYELHQYSQEPAIQCDPLSESSSDESDDLGTASRAAASAENEVKTAAGDKRNDAESTLPVQRDEPRTEVIAGKKVLIAQTPKGIRRFRPTETFLR